MIMHATEPYRATLVDSHCHLFFDELYKHLDEKIKIAKLADVKYLLSVATDSKTMKKNIEISEKYDNVCCSVGIHPHHFSDGYSVGHLKTLLSHKKVVAIGEVGLDYHYKDSTPKKDQISLFEDMLGLSKVSDLPYIIHARECFPEIFEIMRKYADLKALFHCYTDSLENARKILDMGYFLSFSGVVTFKKSEELREVLKYVPDDRLLLETDCPYLAPSPFRGKINEPAYVTFVAECAAQTRNVSLEKIANITTNNFFTLFPKAKILLEENL